MPPSQLKRRLENEYGAEGSGRVEEEKAKYEVERERKLAERRERKALEAKLEKSEELSDSRLARERAALNANDELKAEMEGVVGMDKELTATKAMLARIPSLLPTRGAGHGKGGKSYPLVVEKLAIGQLARRTPPSAAGPNLVQMAKVLVPWIKVRVPPPSPHRPLHRPRHRHRNRRRHRRRRRARP